MRYYFVGCLTFLVSFAALSRSSSHCRFNYSEDAKGCPTSGSTLLDDTYPVSNFVISVSPFRESPSSRNVPVDFIISALSNYDFSENSPNIIVPAFEQDYAELIASLKKRIDASNGMIPPSILSKVIYSPGETYTWQQDYFESFVDLETGRPVVRGIESYENLGEDSISTLAKTGEGCGIKQGPFITSDLDGKSYAWGEMGGNIEGLPGGLCLVGDNLGPKVSAQFCGKTSNVVQIDVSWLGVGHVDEVIKVLPTNRPGVPQECNFSLAYASPKKAMELLNVPHSLQFPFFSGSFLSVSATKQELFEFRVSRGSRTVGEKFCGILKKAIMSRDRPKNPSDQKNGPQQDPQKAKQGLQVFHKMHQLLLSSAYAAEKAQENEPCDQIETLTNAEFIEAMNSSEFGDYNKLVDQTMENNLHKITEAILKKLPQCAPYLDLIPVPDLFYGTPAIDENGVKSLPLPGNGGSFIPNPTNSVVAGKGVIFSDPQNFLFREYLSDNLNKRGLKPSFIDTWDYAHLGDGNLHCSSHSIPFCAPQGKGKLK